VPLDVDLEELDFASLGHMLLADLRQRQDGDVSLDDLVGLGAK